MKKYIILFSILLSSACFVSCELDDWDEPTAEVSGQVIDAITGKPLQSQQPEGYQISLLEDGYSKPNLFWGMADGNFKNTRLFPLKYTVKPTNGPFVDPEVQVVTLPKTGLTFTVQPYVNISGTVSIEGGAFKYSANLKKGAGAKITEMMFIISDGNPNVSTATYSFRGGQDVSQIPDATLVSMTHNGTIPSSGDPGKFYKPLPGKTYYVRFAAKTSSSARYNYSEPIKLVN